MTRRHTLAPALIAAGFVFASCVQMSAPGVPADDAAVAAHKAAARRLAKQGRLGEALVQWKVLTTIDRTDAEATRQLEATQAAIRRETDSHLSAARKALAGGRRKQAMREFLAVLALDPSNREAIRQLREMEAKSVRGRLLEQALANVSNPPATQDATAPNDPGPAMEPSPVAAAPPAKQDQVPKAGAGGRGDSEALRSGMNHFSGGRFRESIALLEKHLATHPGDSEASRLLAEAHLKVAIELYNAGQLRESLHHLEESARYDHGTNSARARIWRDVNDRLAQELYESGVRIYRRDVAKAIELWEETLTYNPDHLKARLYLERTYRMQDTLQQIDSN